jgi:voltage-gated potassium channel
MPTLKQIVENHDTPLSRLYDFTIQGLIVLSMVTFSIDTLPRVSDSARWWLNACEVMTVGLFTVDYLLRIYVARPRLRYVFSFL